MTSERAQAYGRVIKTLDDLGPTKLLKNEQELIRTAADTLLFCDDTADPTVRDTMTDIRTLAAHLVESGRWTDERVSQLVHDIEDTGPVAPVA